MKTTLIAATLGVVVGAATMGTTAALSSSCESEMLSCMVHQPAIGASFEEICEATEAQAQCLDDMGCLTDTQKAMFDVTLSGCFGAVVPDMEIPDMDIPDLGDILGDEAECAEKQLNCVNTIPMDVSSLEEVCSYNENLIQCYTDSGCYTDVLKSEMESAMAQCGTSVPDMDIPDMEIPDMEIPDMEIPDMEIPDMDIPDMEIPDMEIPDVPIPDLSGDLGDTSGDAVECSQIHQHCPSWNELKSCSDIMKTIQCWTDSGCLPESYEPIVKIMENRCSTNGPETDIPDVPIPDLSGDLGDTLEGSTHLPGSNLPMIAGIVSGVVVAGAAAGVYVWKKKKMTDDASLPTVHRSGLNNLEKV